MPVMTLPNEATCGIDWALPLDKSGAWESICYQTSLSSGEVASMWPKICIKVPGSLLNGSIAFQ